MRLEVAPDGSYDVYLRQSWLNDARDCAERGRLTMIDDVRRPTSEAAVMGTAMHAAAEAVCLDDLVSLPEAEQIAVHTWDEIVATEPVRFVSLTEAEARAEVVELTRAWYKGLRHHVTHPVHVEHQFTVPLSTTYAADGTEVRIWLTGTVDLVQTHSLWDWKTSKSRFSWRDRQSDAIQPTVYAYAAVHQGLLTWPVEFKYGVVLRGNHDTQVVHVTRTASHVEWLTRQTEALVQLRLRLGAGISWPMRDNHGLCSDTWCPYWADCKGSSLEYVPFPTRKVAL